MSDWASGSNVRRISPVAGLMDAIAMVGSPHHHSSTIGLGLAGGFTRLLPGGLRLRFLPLPAG